MIKKNFINYGITSKSIQERYNSKKSLPYNFEIIQEIQDIPEIVYNLEKICISYFSNLHYKPILHFNGQSTECFKLK